MRVPADTSLAEWIRGLMEKDRLYRFYKTEEWRNLRATVMYDHHGECEMCIAEGGRVDPVTHTKTFAADTVHHEFEVRDNPALALTRYILCEDGTQREVLHPLCKKHHNEVHERFGGKIPKSEKPPLTVEKW